MSYQPNWGDTNADSATLPPWATCHIEFTGYGSETPAGTPAASIYCRAAEDVREHYRALLGNRLDGNEESICSVKIHIETWRDLERGPLLYLMPVADLGDRRSSAIAEDGRVVEGFRLMYD